MPPLRNPNALSSTVGIQLNAAQQHAEQRRRQSRRPAGVRWCAIRCEQRVQARTPFSARQTIGQTAQTPSQSRLMYTVCVWPARTISALTSPKQRVGELPTPSQRHPDWRNEGRSRAIMPAVSSTSKYGPRQPGGAVQLVDVADQPADESAACQNEARLPARQTLARQWRMSAYPPIPSSQVCIAPLQAICLVTGSQLGGQCSG